MTDIDNKIKTIIIEHLNTVCPNGQKFPNIEPELVLQQLKPIWIKLEEAGLKPHMTFQEFCMIAEQECLFAQLRASGIM